MLVLIWQSEYDSLGNDIKDDIYASVNNSHFIIHLINFESESVSFYPLLSSWRIIQLVQSTNSFPKTIEFLIYDLTHIQVSKRDFGYDI